MDHINYTYTFDESKDNSFEIKFNPITRELKSHKDEIKETAIHIAKTNTKQLYVFSSGGIDSEIISEQFLELGSNFKIITLEIKYGNRHINDYDTTYVNHWCKKNNITQISETFDMDYFIKNDIPRYIDMGFKSSAIYRYMQIYMLEKADELDGIAVLGGRETDIYLNDNNEPCIENGVWFNIAMDYCSKFKKKHYPAFYLQNSEIMASYLKLPVINTMITTPGYFDIKMNKLNNGKILPPSEKVIEYHRLFPKLKLRPKFNGFELLRKVEHDFVQQLKLKFPKESFKHLIPINLIKFQLGI
jgi:hypothetical protein